MLVSRRLIVRSARRQASTVPEQIDRIVKRIVRKFQPERIILFGSQARGDAASDCDVDLLVDQSQIVEGSKSLVAVFGSGREEATNSSWAASACAPACRASRVTASFIKRPAVVKQSG
jgi:hypothetical protein